MNNRVAGRLEEQIRRSHNIVRRHRRQIGAITGDEQPLRVQSSTQKRMEMETVEHLLGVLRMLIEPRRELLDLLIGQQIVVEMRVDQFQGFPLKHFFTHSREIAY
jgi:hypothetical protein